MKDTSFFFSFAKDHHGKNVFVLEEYNTFTQTWKIKVMLIFFAMCGLKNLNGTSAQNMVIGSPSKLGHRTTTMMKIIPLN